jgi:hypothetical protein
MHPATRDSAIVCARINHDVAAAAATNTRLFRFLMIREVRIKRDISDAGKHRIYAFDAALEHSGDRPTCLLLYQSGMVTPASGQLRFLLTVKSTWPRRPNVRPASQMEHPRSASPGINSAPAPAQ